MKVKCVSGLSQIKIPSLWYDQNSDVVYILFMAHVQYMAFRIDNIGGWNGLQDTPEEAVEGLIPWHGKVTLED